MPGSTRLLWSFFTEQYDIGFGEFGVWVFRVGTIDLIGSWWWWWWCVAFEASSSVFLCLCVFLSVCPFSLRPPSYVWCYIDLLDCVYLTRFSLSFCGREFFLSLPLTVSTPSLRLLTFHSASCTAPFRLPFLHASGLDFEVTTGDADPNAEIKIETLSSVDRVRPCINMLLALRCLCCFHLNVCSYVVMCVRACARASVHDIFPTRCGHFHF